MLRISIVAGEASGDYLAAELIAAIRRQRGDVRVEGIGGPRLIAAGCKVLYPMQKLAVMGLLEVAGSFMELLKMRRALLRHFINNPPDVFIGVDAPDFNLSLERALRKKGIKVVHYVSPSVWAWRSYRVKKIAESVDLLLALFPFEKTFYEKYALPVSYVGHPLAEKIKLKPEPKAARQRLGLPQDKTIIALMPGSRASELRRLLPVFLKAAALIQKPNIHFVTSLLTEEAVSYCRETQAKLALEALPLSLYQGCADEVLAAAELALLASGTITLEAMLHKCPMVVAYKLNWFTHKLVLALANVRHASLPNFLSEERLVSECLQGECYPQRLAAELQNLLDDEDLRLRMKKKFTDIHRELKMDSAGQAARAVLKLLDT